LYAWDERKDRCSQANAKTVPDAPPALEIPIVADATIRRGIFAGRQVKMVKML
jgi:hypothetical protein